MRKRKKMRFKKKSDRKKRRKKRRMKKFGRHYSLKRKTLKPL